jgi:UDP-3-O-acyl-N-acetylglucosamine deacetylase
MTSVLSRIAQIRPFTSYIVENNDGYILKTLTLGDTYSLDGNTILSDMGKTVVIDGYIYRKVQVVTVNHVISAGNQTGYICLNSDEAPLFDGSNQGISKLN